MRLMDCPLAWPGGGNQAVNALSDIDFCLSGLGTSERSFGATTEVPVSKFVGPVMAALARLGSSQSVSACLAYCSVAAVISLHEHARSRQPTRRPQRLDEVHADVRLRGREHPPEVARLDVARRDAIAVEAAKLTYNPYREWARHSVPDEVCLSLGRLRTNKLS